MRLPRVKFLLFNKFIEAEIDPKHDKINDPIKKLKSNKINCSYLKLTNKLAKGIIIKKGNCTNIKCDKILSITIN